MARKGLRVNRELWRFIALAVYLILLGVLVDAIFGIDMNSVIVGISIVLLFFVGMRIFQGGRL